MGYRPHARSWAFFPVKSHQQESNPANYRPALRGAVYDSEGVMLFFPLLNLYTLWGGIFPLWLQAILPILWHGNHIGGIMDSM